MQKIKMKVSTAVNIDNTVELPTPEIEAEGSLIKAKETLNETARIIAAEKESSIDAKEIEKNLKPENIKAGETIFGVEGNYELKLQDKNEIVSNNGIHTFLPDEGYDGLGDVNVEIDVEPPLETKYVTITENGDTIVEPDDAYGLEAVNINVDVQPELEEKNVTITENGHKDVLTDEDKYGMNKVSIDVNVQPELQDKTLSITENGHVDVKADEGKYGLDDVSIDVNVQPELQEKALNITENGTTDILPDEGKYGLSKASVTVNVQPELQDKELTITENGEQEVNADEGKYGLHTVNIITNVQPELEEKTVEPGQSPLIILPSEGKYGLSKVNVNGDANLIESNIKEGVTIFGVDGTFSGGGAGGDSLIIVSRNANGYPTEVDASGLTMLLPQQFEAMGYAYDIYDKMSKIKLSSKITEIPERCFQRIYNRPLNIEGNSKIQKIGQYAFANENGYPFYTLNCEPFDCLAEVGQKAFCGIILQSNEKDQEIIDSILRNLTIIPSMIFSQSSLYVNINIPDITTTISSLAFDAKYSYGNITIGKGVKTIENSAFSGYIPNKIIFNATNCDDINITDSQNIFPTFNNMYSTSTTESNIEIGDNVTRLPSRLFQGRSSNYKTCIGTISGGKNVKEIGTKCFYYSGTKSYYGKNRFLDDELIRNVETISDNAFNSFYLMNNTFNFDNLVTIGNSAFSYSSIGTVVNFSNKLKSIGNMAFLSNNIVNITIPESVETIGTNYTFCDSSKLISYTDLSGKTSGSSSSGSASVGNCTLLTTAQIGSIGHPMSQPQYYNIFNGCTALTTINIYTESGSVLDGAPFGAANTSLVINWYDATTGELVNTTTPNA